MNSSSFCVSSKPDFLSILCGRAQATAVIAGSKAYPAISGTVGFYQTKRGVIICAEIKGLPQNASPCHERIFGFHIHKGTDCGSSRGDPFSDTMSHYDPNNCAHPYHAGDLPPLFGSNGFAFSIFLTNRFSVEEVIGKTVIIHDHPDDFTTQPSGNSGTKIACGVIRRSSASRC